MSCLASENKNVSQNLLNINPVKPKVFSVLAGGGEGLLFACFVVAVVFPLN